MKAQGEGNPLLRADWASASLLSAGGNLKRRGITIVAMRNPLQKAPLRKRAEERLGGLQEASSRTGVDIEWLVHELRVHQIELEMHNEEMDEIRTRLEMGLERFPEFHDSVPMGLVSINREGVIRAANRVAADLIGMERFRLINRPLDRFVSETERPALKTFLERVFAGGVDEACELRLAGNGGTRSAVTVSATVSEDGKECLAILADITELKKKEEALREELQHHRDLFENALVAISQVDEGGAFLRANKCFEELTGYTQEELKDVNIWEIMNPDGTGRVKEMIAEQISGEGAPIFLEESYVCKDGSRKWGEIRPMAIRDERGRFLSAVVAIVDRTRGKQMEALANNESLGGSFFENASIAMFHATLEPNRLLRVNSAYSRMLGYESPEDLMSASAGMDAFPVEAWDRKAFLAAMEQRNWYDGDYPLICREGGILIGKAAIRSVLKPDGSIDHLEGLVENITERKRAEKVLQKRDRELQEKTKSLEEVDAALKVLLKNLEKNQEELTERFLINIREQVLPCLVKLKKTPLNQAQRALINSAEAYLDEIASPFVQKLTSSYLNLTKKEVQIAVLVRDGKTSKEIAEIVNVSKSDVDFHRGKLREKLGLKNQKRSLTVLLRTLSHEGPRERA